MPQIGVRSTIWGQLEDPLSPIGSLPYISTDGVSIETDVLHFSYQSGTAIASGTLRPYQHTAWGGYRLAFTDSSTTPGAITINKPAGRVKIAAGASSIVVTSNYCFSSSIVLTQMEGAVDTTLTRIRVTPSDGSFTISGNAAATAALAISFVIFNVVAP